MSAGLTVRPLPVVAWEYDDPEYGFPGMPCTRFSDVPPGRALNSQPLVRKADADAAIASLQARLYAAERRYHWLRGIALHISELNAAQFDANVDALSQEKP
jgi:hypothetical protein